MDNMIVCSGNLVPVKNGLVTLQGAIGCDVDWTIVPYVEPTDSTAIYAQLVALNEFDPERVAIIIVTCLVTFLVGFGAGVVIKLLRRL